MIRAHAPYLLQLLFSARAAPIFLLPAVGGFVGGCGGSVPESASSEQGGSAGVAGKQSPGGSASAGVSGSMNDAGGAPGGAGAANGAGGSAGVSAGGSSGSGFGESAGVGGGAGGGGSGTAGAIAGGGTGGQSGGPISCAQSNYLICEDFESTASGSVPAGWNKQGDIEVSTDDAYHSAHSLKVFVSAGKSENYRRISMNPSKLGTGHWGRVYYKVQAPVPAYFAHDTFVAFTGNGPDAAFKNESVRVVDTVHNADQTHQFLYNVQPAGNEFGKGSPYPYTFKDGGWHCAEWHIDNPTQSYHFYYDGTEVTAIAIDNGAGKYKGSEIPAAFTQLTVGVSQYQSPPSGFTQQPLWFTAWIDNLALDTNRIGCQ